jgi:hypothetical protein
MKSLPFLLGIFLPCAHPNAILTITASSQTTLNRGTVLRMGKGFTMPNVQGRDLSDMFHEAFKRKVSFFFIVYHRRRE